MGQLNFLQKIVRIAAYIIFNSVHISKKGDFIKSNRLAIEVKGFIDIRIRRLDNELIYANAYNYFKPCNHVLVYRRLQLDIRGFLNRILSFFRYMGQIDGLRLCDRAFLAVQLIVCKNFIMLLRKENIFLGCQYLLLFEEQSLIPNTLSQTAKLHNITVVTLQHSMPMNRHEDSDQVLFDCFSCDYKLLWNEAAKKEFLSAGIDEEHLIVVGNTKKMHMPIAEKKNQKPRNAIGIILDGPGLTYAAETNRKLIHIGITLAIEFELGCVIKLHPIDKKENYLSETRSSFTKMSILDASTPMEEYEELVDFSLGHTTGAIFDLIYDNCFVFQYKTEVKYPIETDDIYVFHDYEELKFKYMQWIDNYEEYQRDYEKIVKNYRVENPLELHDRFFETLFKKLH